MLAAKAPVCGEPASVGCSPWMGEAPLSWGVTGSAVEAVLGGHTSTSLDPTVAPTVASGKVRAPEEQPIQLLRSGGWMEAGRPLQGPGSRRSSASRLKGELFCTLTFRHQGPARWEESCSSHGRCCLDTEGKWSHPALLEGAVA